MALRIGCQTLVFGPRFASTRDALTAFDVVAEAGFQGVEIAQPPVANCLGFRSIDELLAALSARGLELIGMSGGSVEDRVDFLGSTKLPFLYSDEFGLKEQQALRRGYRIAIHPHAYCEIATCAKAQELLGSFPGLELLPDSAHAALAGENFLEILHRNEAFIRAVHLKDWTGAKEASPYQHAFGFCDLGEGKLPLKLYVDAIRKMPRIDWLIWEVDKAKPSILRSIETSVLWLRDNGFKKLNGAALSNERSLPAGMDLTIRNFSTKLCESLYSLPNEKLTAAYRRICSILRDEQLFRSVQLWGHVSSTHSFLRLDNTVDADGMHFVDDDHLTRAVCRQLPTLTKDGLNVAIPILDPNNPHFVHHVLIGDHQEPLEDSKFDDYYCIGQLLGMALENVLRANAWEAVSWVNAASSKCSTEAEFLAALSEKMVAELHLRGVAIHMRNSVEALELKAHSGIKGHLAELSGDFDVRDGLTVRAITSAEGREIGKLYLLRSDDESQLDDDRQFLVDAIWFSAVRNIMFRRSKSRRDRLRENHLHSIRQPLCEMSGFVHKLNAILTKESAALPHNYISDLESYVALISDRADAKRQPDAVRIQGRSPTFLIRDVLASVTRQLQQRLRERSLSRFAIDYSQCRLPKLLIDRTAFQRVFLNLLLNAIKYAYADPASFSVTIVGKLTETSITITIADLGIGVPTGEDESIFEFGVRGSNAIEKAKGDGYGLFFVRQIVEEHQGTIKLIRNKLPTVFQITLPRTLVVLPTET